MRWVCGLVLAAFAACEEPPAPATLTEVPARFVGLWDVSVADCNVGGGSQAVRIASDEIVFSDSRLAVTGAAPDGDTAARIDGRFTGPGAQWDGAVRLELDGGTLSVVNGSNVVPRVKCP